MSAALRLGALKLNELSDAGVNVWFTPKTSTRKIDIKP